MRSHHLTHLLGILLLAASPALADSPLTIQPVGDESPEGFSRVFSKQVDVFGIPVFATSRTPDNKVLHAAGVLAQYLDNDADGTVDNRQVLEMMKKNKAGMVMTATERSFERLDVHRFIPERIWDSMILQGLYGEETIPGGIESGKGDASLEEVLHLVTQAGYASAYPQSLGERPGTELALAMDKARGGHFRRVPTRYPRGAWYTYDDRSCDYRCQVTEYIYWGLTSLLGGQQYPGRLENIQHEWRLNTAEKVRRGDPALYRILSDAKYKFPTRLPDGKYVPRSSN